MSLRKIVDILERRRNVKIGKDKVATIIQSLKDEGAL